MAFSHSKQEGIIASIVSRVIAFADRAIAVHHPHLDILVKHGNPRAKFSVLLNVPDHRIFQPQRRHYRPRERFRLMYHGTIPKRAGLESALKAIARARQEVPHLQFLIVGGAADQDPLKQLIQDLDLTNCVELRPNVPVDELPAIMAEVDVGIVPYMSDAFTQYVLPTKLLEYVAVGVPAIVSRLRTVETYFDPNMIAYFDPGNEAELAEQILRLYRNRRSPGLWPLAG